MIDIVVHAGTPFEWNNQCTLPGSYPDHNPLHLGYTTSLLYVSQHPLNLVGCGGTTDETTITPSGEKRRSKRPMDFGRIQ